MAIPTKGRKKKEKKQQLVERTPGSPLKLFSKNLLTISRRGVI